MNESQINKVLRSIILDGLTAQGLTGVEVLQKFQPVTTGAPEGRVVYFQKIHEHKYGYQGRRNVYNSDQGRFDTQLSQWKEHTYQVNARVQEEPADTANDDHVNAFDLVSLVTDILQFPSTLETLQTNNLCIYRITDVKDLYENNDKDQFEKVPVSDFVISNRKIYNTNTAAVNTHRLNFNRV